MNEVLTVIVAVSGAGFGLGLCGVALMTLMSRVGRRPEQTPDTRRIDRIA